MHKPTREAGAQLFLKYMSALKTHKSVAVVAAMYGISPKSLSVFLNRKSRKARWRKLRETWRKEHRREARRRGRARARQKYLMAKVDEILALGRPPELLHPLQVRLLCEAGVLSRADAEVLAARREHWRLKDPGRFG